MKTNDFLASLLALKEMENKTLRERIAFLEVKIANLEIDNKELVNLVISSAIKPKKEIKIKHIGFKADENETD